MPKKQPGKRPTQAEIATALMREVRSPLLAEIAAHFVDLVQGPRGFAQLLFTEFTKAAEGGVARQRILSDVMQALKFANTKEEGKTDLGILSEADLKAELEQALRAVVPAGVRESEVFDSPEEPDGAPEPAAG